MNLATEKTRLLRKREPLSHPPLKLRHPWANFRNDLTFLMQNEPNRELAHGPASHLGLGPLPFPEGGIPRPPLCGFSHPSHRPPGVAGGVRVLPGLPGRGPRVARDGPRGVCGPPGPDPPPPPPKRRQTNTPSQRERRGRERTSVAVS